MLCLNKSYKNRKVSLTIHCKYEYFDSTVQRAEDRRQKFYFCQRLPFAVKIKLNLSIISHNTERGSLKLTRRSCRIKSAWNGKFISKGTLKYKAKLTFELKCSSSYSQTCDQVFFVFFLRGGLDSITIQSNHLLGKPRYTLTKRLLANLSNCDFSLVPKNGLETEVFKAHVKFNDFAAWLFSPVSLPCLSRQEML